MNKTIEMYLVKNPTGELLNRLSGNLWWRVDIFCEEFIINECERSISSFCAVQR